MSERPRRLLVFDLDDTLYPERAFVLSGFRAAAERLASGRGIAGFYEHASGLFEGGLRGRIFDEALAGLGVGPDPALVADLVDAYRAHRPSIALHDDARWALDHFGRTHRLALLTDGYAATQRNKVDALGIAGRFEAIVYSDDLGRDGWKPSPRPFRAIMEAAGVSGDDCVYVADNPLKDFIAPRALGWGTVRVRRHGGEYAHLAPVEGHEADHEVSSLYGLSALLAHSEVPPRQAALAEKFPERPKKPGLGYVNVSEGT